MYVAISLEDGHYWDTPSYKLRIAVQELTFIGRNNKITIEVNND